MKYFFWMGVVAWEGLTKKKIDSRAYTNCFIILKAYVMKNKAIYRQRSMHFQQLGML